jgi:hypothetical protein
MKWFVIFSPFACLKLLLLGLCFLTVGILVAINLLINEIDGSNGGHHVIADDSEHVYSPPSRHRFASRHQ